MSDNEGEMVRDGARLRQRWDDRYATFSLDESSCMGAGLRFNRLLYRIKCRALTRALRAAGFAAAKRFSVLDMGCGLAYFAVLYHVTFPLASYVGVDISPRAIEHDRVAYPGDAFHAADIVSWREPSGARFDVVQSIEVLQLLTDDAAFDAAVGNLAAHLADDGIILMPMAFSDRPALDTRQRFRTRAYFDRLLGTMGLTVVDEIRLYYWFIDGGPQNPLLRAIFSRTGTWSLYALDRIAVRLGVRNRNVDQVLSTAHLLTIRRVPPPPTDPRSTRSEN